MPKVSVVIPNYNYGRYLEQRLRTIVGQTYQDLEILYLDDCSTDHSDAVLEPFLVDRDIRVVRNAVNSGSASGQFNKGSKLARGAYIWIAQADDYADPEFLAEMVPVLDRNPAVGLAYCQSLAVDDDGTVLHAMSKRTDVLDAERWRHDHINDGRDECRRFLLFKNTIPNASAVLFRREALEAAGWADETLMLAWDYLTYVNILLISDVAYLARPMNYFRHHAGSIRGRSDRAGLQAKEGYRVLAHLRDRLELSEAEMEAALSRMARAWLRKVLRRRKRIPLAAAADIYRMAREIDPRLNVRLLRRLLHN